MLQKQNGFERRVWLASLLHIPAGVLDPLQGDVQEGDSVVHLEDLVGRVPPCSDALHERLREVEAAIEKVDCGACNAEGRDGVHPGGAVPVCASFWKELLKSKNPRSQRLGMREGWQLQRQGGFVQSSSARPYYPVRGLAAPPDRQRDRRAVIILAAYPEMHPRSPSALPSPASVGAMSGFELCLYSLRGGYSRRH